MKSLTQLLSKTLLTSFLTYSSLYGASNGLYVEASGGVGLSDEQDTKQVAYTYEQGYLASLSIGYHLNLWRVELQQRYTSDDLYSQSTETAYYLQADGKLTNSSQMLNLYYSSGYNYINLITSIGIGLGVSTIEIEDVVKESNLFSAQALLNVGYKINEHFVLLGNYAYFYSSKGDTLEEKGDSTFSLGLRYNF